MSSTIRCHCTHVVGGGCVPLHTERAHDGRQVRSLHRDAVLLTVLVDHCALNGRNALPAQQQFDEFDILQQKHRTGLKACMTVDRAWLRVEHGTTVRSNDGHPIVLLACTPLLTCTMTPGSAFSSVCSTKNRCCLFFSSALTSGRISRRSSDVTLTKRAERCQPAPGRTLCSVCWHLVRGGSQKVMQRSGT